MSQSSTTIQHQTANIQISDRVKIAYTEQELPLVSVIIPCYNGRKYLAETLQSVLNQTLKNFEVIIIEDGSKEPSRDIVAYFNDDRLRYFVQENTGLSGARNTGIRLARAKYLNFLDADDNLMPRNLEILYNYLETNPSVSMVSSGYERIDEEGKVFDIGVYPRQKTVTVEEQLQANRFVVPGNLMRKEDVEEVEGFDVSLRGSEEWDFHSRLILKGKRLDILPTVLRQYRFVKSSLGQNIEMQERMRLQVLEKLYQLPAAAAYQHLKPAAEGWIKIKSALWYLMNKKVDTAVHYVNEVVQLGERYSKNNYEHLLRFFINMEEYYSQERNLIDRLRQQPNLQANLSELAVIRLEKQLRSRKQAEMAWKNKRWLGLATNGVKYVFHKAAALL